MHFLAASLTAKGTKLTPADRKYVLSAFVNRFTREHKPKWAVEPRGNGQPYPVQFASDEEWLANTRFAVTRSGRLDQRVGECHSVPTWPDNPELRSAA